MGWDGHTPLGIEAFDTSEFAPILKESGGAGYNANNVIAPELAYTVTNPGPNSNQFTKVPSSTEIAVNFAHRRPDQDKNAPVIECSEIQAFERIGGGSSILSLLEEYRSGGHSVNSNLPQAKREAIFSPLIKPGDVVTDETAIANFADAVTEDIAITAGYEAVRQANKMLMQETTRLNEERDRTYVRQEALEQAQQKALNEPTYLALVQAKSNAERLYNQCDEPNLQLKDQLYEALDQESGQLDQALIRDRQKTNNHLSRVGLPYSGKEPTGFQNPLKSAETKLIERFANQECPEAISSKVKGLANWSEERTLQPGEREKMQRVAALANGNVISLFDLEKIGGNGGSWEDLPDDEFIEVARKVLIIGINMGIANEQCSDLFNLAYEKRQQGFELGSVKGLRSAIRTMVKGTIPAIAYKYLFLPEDNQYHVRKAEIDNGRQIQKPAFESKTDFLQRAFQDGLIALSPDETVVQRAQRHQLHVLKAYTGNVSAGEGATKQIKQINDITAGALKKNQLRVALDEATGNLLDYEQNNKGFAVPDFEKSPQQDIRADEKELSIAARDNIIKTLQWERDLLDENLRNPGNISDNIYTTAALLLIGTTTDITTSGSTEYTPDTGIGGSAPIEWVRAIAADLQKVAENVLADNTNLLRNLRSLPRFRRIETKIRSNADLVASKELAARRSAL